MSFGVPFPFIGMTSGRGTPPGVRIESRDPDFLVNRLVHSRPQSIRSFWPPAGIESSGCNHFRHAP